MIHIEIRKVTESGLKCDNFDCSHSQDLFDKVITTYYMKQDTTYAAVYLGGKVDYYCRNCIDVFYKIVKSQMDTKLWAFK